MDKVITINGQEITLETRTCAGGCGRSFSVTPNSAQVYARQDCEQACQKVPLTKEQVMRSRRPRLTMPQPVETKVLTRSDLPLRLLKRGDALFAEHQNKMKPVTPGSAEWKILEVFCHDNYGKATAQKLIKAVYGEEISTSQSERRQQLDRLQKCIQRTRRKLETEFEGRWLPNAGYGVWFLRDIPEDFEVGGATEEWSQTKPNVLARMATRPRTENKELEDRWDAYVNKARYYVNKMNKYRMRIAACALEACELTRGGGDHWKDFKGRTTMRDFADAIGVNHKTLHEWVAIKRNVVDKLPADQYVEDDYPSLVKTHRRTTRRSHPSEVLSHYQYERRRRDDAYILAQINKQTKTAHTFVCVKGDLEKCRKEELEELRDRLSEMVERLDKFLPSVRTLKKA